MMNECINFRQQQIWIYKMFQLQVDMSTWANTSQVESTDASLKLSADQESTLDCHFRRNKNMHPSDVTILSAETGLPEQQVQVRQTNSIKMVFQTVIY